MRGIASLKLAISRPVVLMLLLGLHLRGEEVQGARRRNPRQDDRACREARGTGVTPGGKRGVAYGAKSQKRVPVLYLPLFVAK